VLFIIVRYFSKGIKSLIQKKEFVLVNCNNFVTFKDLKTKQEADHKRVFKNMEGKFCILSYYYMYSHILLPYSFGRRSKYKLFIL